MNLLIHNLDTSCSPKDAKILSSIETESAISITLCQLEALVRVSE